MSWAVWESRLPVGSSATRTGVIVGQGTGDRHPLLLAAREHAGQPSRGGLRAPAPGKPWRARASVVAPAHPRRPIREPGGRSPARSAWAELIKLKDDTDVPATPAGQVVLTQSMQILPCEENAPARRPVNAGQQVKGRRLAAARRPGDSEQAPNGHGEVDVIEDNGLAGVLPDAAREVLDLNQHVGAPRRRRALRLPRAPRVRRHPGWKRAGRPQSS